MTCRNYEKMPTVNIKSLPFINIPLYEVQSVYITSDFKILSFICEDSLVLQYINKEICCSKQLKNVKRFIWQDDNLTSEDYHLITITSSNLVHYYTISVQHLENHCDCAFLLHIEQTFSFIEELSLYEEEIQHVDILLYTQQKSVFLMNNEIVLIYVLTSNNKHEKYLSINVAVDFGPVSYYQIYNDKLFTLNNGRNVLSLFSLLTGMKESEWDFNLIFFNNEVERCFKVFVAADIRTAIICSNELKLYQFQLDKKVKTDFKKSSKNIVTAFAKKMPSFTKITEGIRNNTSKFHQISIEQLDLPSDLKDDICFEDIEMQILGESIFIYISKVEYSYLFILQSSGLMVTCERFNSKIVIIKKVSSLSSPLLFLYNDNICTFLINVNAEKLVSELMFYYCGTVAENISLLNNWQDINVKSEILEEGLKNRQLDIIAFFLKMHEEGFYKLWTAQKLQNKEWICQINVQFTYWDSVITMLLNCVKESIYDTASCQFAEQLLQLIVTVLTNLINTLNIEEKKPEINDENTMLYCKSVSEANIKFAKYFKTTRLLLYEQNDYDENEILTNETSESEDIILKEQWNNWSKMTWQEAIQDAIRHDNLLSLQGYLLTNYLSKSEIQDNLWKIINQIGMSMAENSISNGNLCEALQIFINMGLSPEEKLMDIFKNTSNNELRKTLFSKLDNDKLLSDKDEKIIHFIDELNYYYPLSKEIELHFPRQVLENVDFSHNNIVFNWVANWSENICTRIILAGINDYDSPKIASFSPEICWEYFLEYENIDKLNKWITNIFTRKQLDFPFGWTINGTMLNKIKLFSTNHVQEAVLNILGRIGIFCEEELEDFPSLLRRFGCIHFSFGDKSILQCSSSSISVSDFTHRIIHYSLEQNIPNFLYYFLNENLYSTESLLHCLFCSTPLLGMISSFSKWSKMPDDSDVAFQAILNTAQYVYNMPEPSLQALWKYAPIELVIAAVLFAPMSLSQFIQTVSKGLMGVDSKFLEDSLSSIPLLRDALFNVNDGKSKMKLDVSVYQLLQDNASFDPSRLFGWQTTNNIKNEDAMTELPHFSLSNLVETYGYKKKLTFHYYLLNGRPSYAYAKFIVKEIAMAGTITVRRTSAACKEALLLAIRNYSITKITSACILFTEMLGHDSLKLRTYIQIALIVHKARNSDKDIVDSEIVTLLEISLDNKNAAQEFLSILVPAVQREINLIGRNKNSAAEIMWWIPVVAFCQIHQLEYVTIYMKERAQAGDWLKFLIFAQLFQIPPVLVLKLLSEFSNKYLVDHLSGAFQQRHSLLVFVDNENVSSCVRSMKIKQTSKEFRETLYTRIGVTKDAKVASSGSATEISSDDDTSSLCSEDTVSSNDLVLLCDDLWGQILICHNSDSPWRSLLQASCLHCNPIFAVIAASYEGACIIQCLATWLYISIEESESNEGSLEKTIDDLENIMTIAIKKGKIILLQKGLLLFLPDSLLLLLINYLVTFMVNKQYESSTEYLREFQRHFWNFSDEKNETNILNEVKWIEKMSVKLLTSSIISCETIYEKILMSGHFYFAKIQNMFPTVENVPDFNKLYKLLQYVGDLDIDINLEDILDDEQSEKYKESCTSIIEKLQQQQQNNDAYMFAKIAKLPLDEILLCQISNETKKIKKLLDWNDLKKRIQYWKQCANVFKIGNIKPEIPAYFFKEECDLADSYVEKYILIKLATDWFMKAPSLSEDIFKVLNEWDVNLWLYCIKGIVEMKKLNLEDLIVSEIERNCEDFFDCHQENLNTSYFPLKLETDEEILILEQIIGKLLNAGNLKQAQKLNNLFFHKSKDVNIVKICLNLAQEIILPTNPEVVSLISEIEQSMYFPQNKIFGEGDLASHISSHQNEVINTIRKLGAISKDATLACKRILIYYSVAKILDQTYDDIKSQSKSFSLIKTILTCSYPEKYALAKDLLIANSVSNDEITEFLSEEVMSCLQIYTGIAEFSIPQSNNELIFNPSNTKSFQQLLHLCDDPSLLGTRLLNIIDREMEKKVNVWTKSNLSLVVELYIRSHDCFSATCNMEGISKVLHRARNLARNLTDSQEFQLLVRLLTGIGRYSEMTYIFDILRESRQFELLFRKGMEKVPNLRLALLDYLKRCQTVDSDVYSMLALNFSMFREIAEILEKSARDSVIKIRKKKTGNANVKDDLVTTMHEFADAAESFCKADCLFHAEECILQAKLVALQIHLLPSGIWIIGLIDKEVSKFIEEHNKFCEAYIVSQAYKDHHSWAPALFRQVIEKGNWEYFSEFEKNIGLTSILIEDIARRLLLLNPKFENQINNMKKLIECTDPETKYKIASEFDFQDIISDLLEGDSGPYIKDLIIKHRKKNTN